MIVLIPAFEPGPALIALVDDLVRTAPHVPLVVVDDGSGPDYRVLFATVERAGATVLVHDRNRGKGAALRTGIAHVCAAHPGESVVTADADGQHTVRDILRVGAAVGAAVDASDDDVDGATGRDGPPPMVLGCRGFDGSVPLRSRVGNTAARAAFRLAAGWSLSDTQTGLRGIPAALLPWALAQSGDRFEYEQNVLLHVRRDGGTTREIPIETVYVAGNSSSHFRPIVDSLRVGMPLVLFAASSLLAFVVDTVALVALTALTGWLVPSIIAARVLSATVNFAVNRHVVFGDGVPWRRAAARYLMLAASLVVSNIVWITALTSWGVPLLAAKLVTESLLFVLGYVVQRGAVFAGSNRPSRRPALEWPVKAPLSNGEDSGTRMVADTPSPRRNP